MTSEFNHTGKYRKIYSRTTMQCKAMQLNTIQNEMQNNTGHNTQTFKLN